MGLFYKDHLRLTIKGKKAQRIIEVKNIGGVSINVNQKVKEFTIHVPSEYDYRFNSEK